MTRTVLHRLRTEYFTWKKGLSMLHSMIDKYIALLAQDETAGTQANTVMAYRNDLNQLSLYIQQQGIDEWSEVTHEHITNYLLVMRDTFSYRPTTIARKLAAYKSFFRYLRQAGSIRDDLIGHVETPRIEKEPPQFLTLEQIEHLFAQVDTSTVAGQRDITMLHLLSATGVRASEIVSLDVLDINMQERMVYVGRRHEEQRELHEAHEQNEHDEEQQEQDEGQSEAHSYRGRERALPLPDAVVEVLQSYLEKSRPLLLRHGAQDALFLNHHGERLTRQGFWLIIKGYARAANIENITPHMLRHSFAMLMLREGKELRSVQEMLGHAHISTTQVYNQFVHAR